MSTSLSDAKRPVLPNRTNLNAVRNLISIERIMEENLLPSAETMTIVAKSGAERN